MGSTSELSTAEIFQEYAAFAWRALRHLGVREADAEDVCQEVFVIVHRKLAEFEGRSTVRTWLYSICLRVAKDYRKRAHIRYEEATAEPPEGEYEDTQGVAIDRARALDAFGRSLEALDDDKRAVFVLYEIEGLSMKEVAEATNCPLQTAYSRLHAARELVLLAMKRFHGAEE